MDRYDRRRRRTRRILGCCLALVAALAGCSQSVAPTTPPLTNPGAIGGIGSFAAPSFGGPVLPSGGGVLPAAAGSSANPPSGGVAVLPSGAVPSVPGISIPGAGGAPGGPQAGDPGAPGAPAGPGTGIPAPGATLGPPSWVKAGTRITFYEGAASVAQSRFSYVEDPTGPLEDPRTGKNYRKTDPSTEPTATASGDGVSQIDIIAVEGTDVVFVYTPYGIDHATNSFVAAPASGSRVPGASISGVYFHPDQLAQVSMQDLGSALLVLRGDYPLGQTVYHAVSFVNTDPAAYASYTYDRDTGLLLSSTTTTAGATSPVTEPGQPPPVGNTYMTITRLIGMRQRTVPGLDGTNPDWLARSNQLPYAGDHNTVSTIDPSSMNVTSPMQLKVTFGQGGRNWAPYTAQSVIQQPGFQPTTGTGVTGTSGLYWIDQRALAGMTAGQVLDQDPLTTEQLAVAATDSATVTLTSKLPGVSVTNTYDRASGVLLAEEAHQDGAAAAMTIRLQLQNRP
jgi:hypothetical protein